ncbi:GAF domain-containing protein [Amycolatopsis sp. OK19-0408]|uniref:GAF domain-containing protein n=1 Tax=Amycolatopsis iheyensis TaxID=2945988 RepID=A0A9X2SP78_9PSEU|nr:GAF domain-containing protein [Amycolatopsis iheyensis]MCR6489609.1 GAF domain-containing protein [Amycolatopsis iheyensis]
MTGPDTRRLLASAIEVRRRSAHQRGRLTAEFDQRLIDAEVRDTRSRLVRSAHRRAGGAAAVLFDTEFLAVADAPATWHAILDAALGVAEACDLQLLDGGTLIIGAHHGFSREFLDFFAAVDATSPTACGRALATGAPVVVDDVAVSPVFADRAVREVLLDEGSRAVASYPLHTPGGAVFGVLSFHRTRPPARFGGLEHLIARGAGAALARTLKRGWDPAAPDSAQSKRDALP